MNEENIKDTQELLVKLIQNQCVNPPGNELASIRTIENFLTSKGISCQIFESAPNRGNLVARIKGSGNGPRLMFGPSHVDVVPVPTPEKWTSPPFLGEIKDGYIWGRGAMDMLFIVATQVVAFSQLVQENFQPQGDLILLIVSGEETGGEFGIKWMLKNHSELIETDFAVSEMGGVSLAPKKIVFMMGEKGATWKRIKMKGGSGHSSMPFKSDNATVNAAQAIIRLQEYCDNKIPITTKYIGNLTMGLGMNPIIRFLLARKKLLPIFLKLLSKKQPDTAKLFHCLSRMTISPNICQSGTNPNVIPTESIIDCDIRTLPDQDENYINFHLKKALGDLADKAEFGDIEDDDIGIKSYGNQSQIPSKFVTAMQNAVKKEMPGATLVPFLFPAASDLRCLRKIGVNAYGFSLMDEETTSGDMSNLPHGINERVSLKSLELSLKVYYNLAKDFL